MGLFRRGRGASGPDLSGLGSSHVAVAAAGGAMVPKGCTGLVFDVHGNARRVAAGQRAACAASESVRVFHPGPYAFDVVPYAAAPEIGLRFEVAVDSPDPRLTQQRFDLFLVSEVPQQLELANLQASVEAAVQRELAQGKLLLPPCTTLDEWNAFRQGVNELVYVRFGMIVDDCLPVDLGGRIDFAAVLSARAVQTDYSEPPGAAGWAQRAAQAVGAAPGGAAEASADAHALRRLFLELPCVMSGLRLAFPYAQVSFADQCALLARLDAAALSVDTMPSFALAAPAEPLDAAGRARRATASLAALEALDEAWALLARLRAAGAGVAAVDDADRIAANLETALAARRSAREGVET